ncbi:MAG: UMP kinase [archaeon]
MFEDMFEMFNEQKKNEDTEITMPVQERGYSGEASEESYQSQPSFPVSNVTVISVGGSILMDGKPSSEAISALAACLNELIRQGHRLVLVVGGGKVARDYVNAAKALGANNFELDELGIRITRANAALLLASIENAFPEVLTEVKKAKEILARGKTPIYGGLMPGFTTDAVAALIAEYLGARFVNLSNVEGIFTADPAVYSNARLYRELSHSKLIEILAGNAMKPGQNLILDLPAAMILKRSGIPAFFLSGHELENFKNALNGLEFRGTTVKADALDLIEGEEGTFAVPRAGRTRAKRRPVKKGRAKKTAKIYDEDEEPSVRNTKF